MITGFPTKLEGFVVMFDNDFFIYGDHIAMRGLTEDEVNELWRKENMIQSAEEIKAVNPFPRMQNKLCCPICRYADKNALGKKPCCTYPARITENEKGECEKCTWTGKCPQSKAPCIHIRHSCGTYCWLK